jgi:short-subunit dehydrogenase
MSALENKTVIITGASSGIGEASARRLAKAGANLVLFARRAERLEELRRSIDPAGRRVLCVSGDVTVQADRERVVADTMARFGRIDGLVNNAGYGQRGPIECIPLDAIRGNFETNVFALLGVTQLVAPVMRAQGAGRVVNIGSVAGRIARPMTSTYDATKHALEAFTDGLRGELKPFGVQVILVRPGYIITEFSKTAEEKFAAMAVEPGAYAPHLDSFRTASRSLKRLAGTPDQVARAIEHALGAAHPQTHYNVPGHAKVFLFLKWLLPVRVMDFVLRGRR